MANRVIFSFVIVLSLINSAAASEGSCNTTAPQNTITVNTLLDLDTDSDAKCSLREAIINANNGDASGSPDCFTGSFGADVINIQIPGAIILNSALPSVSSDITINGNAEGTTIDGQETYRVFYHNLGGTTLILRDLTIKNGNAAEFLVGGAILNESGSLEVHECAFHRNMARSGGAIHNSSGNALIKNSTFTQNRATHLTETATGGAVANGGGWTTTIVNGTFNDNIAKTSGSSIENVSGIVYVYNSIIAFGDNVENCSGTITNMGNNIDTGTSCGFGSDKSSQSGVDPLFGSQGFYGGPTNTIPLVWGSPAIDGVVYAAPNSCDTWDQRGVTRPLDGDRDGLVRGDIGAYEADWEESYLPVVRN